MHLCIDPLENIVVPWAQTMLVLGREFCLNIQSAILLFFFEVKLLSKITLFERNNIFIELYLID